MWNCHLTQPLFSTLARFPLLKIVAWLQDIFVGWVLPPYPSVQQKSSSLGLKRATISYNFIFIYLFYFPRGKSQLLFPHGHSVLAVITLNNYSWSTPTPQRDQRKSDFTAPQHTVRLILQSIARGYYPAWQYCTSGPGHVPGCLDVSCNLGYFHLV